MRFQIHLPMSKKFKLLVSFPHLFRLMFVYVFLPTLFYNIVYNFNDFFYIDILLF